MRVALAQIVSTTEPAANLGLVRDAAGSAAAAGARLLVLPEATMCAFGIPLRPVAEPLDGPWATAVRDIARDAGLTVVLGMFCPAEDGRVRNTLLVTGAGVEAAYDKIHLFDAFGFRESDTVAPGTAPMVIDIDGVRVGLATCYDLRFPGLFTALADRGAELIVVPASWGAGPGKAEQWSVLTRARALDTTCFLVACDQADPLTVGVAPRGAAPTGIGGSVAVSPLGSVLGRLDRTPGLLVVDLPTDQVGAARSALPVLANRRC